MEKECSWCGKSFDDDSFFGGGKSFCSLKCEHEFSDRGYELKKSDCFVATAVYKSRNHPVVVDLRNFRDDYLEMNRLGRLFIRFYYKHGPKIARIARNEGIRILLLTFLIKPIHFFIKLFTPSIRTSLGSGISDQRKN
jgi:hypothetical protein